MDFKIKEIWVSNQANPLPLVYSSENIAKIEYPPLIPSQESVTFTLISELDNEKFSKYKNFNAESDRTRLLSFEY